MGCSMILMTRRIFGEYENPFIIEKEKLQQMVGGNVVGR